MAKRAGPAGDNSELSETLAAARSFLAGTSTPDRPLKSDTLVDSANLGALFERSVNQKLHGAYYSPPQITRHLCEGAIHRHILDAVNDSERRFATLLELLSGLDDGLAIRLLTQVLPRVSVLDPACGAGAFLLAAAEILVASYEGVCGWIDHAGGRAAMECMVDIGETAARRRTAFTRRVLEQNLFGVDLMPEAIEVARMRLHLALAATLEPNESVDPPPIHLSAGNTLVGALDAEHSSDDALLQQFQEFGIRHERATWDASRRRPGKPMRRAMTLEDVAKLRPLHWPTIFGEVMDRGGFDVIVTNPPWDVLKPNGKEFFEGHSELVTKKSMTIGDFEAEQGRLLEDGEVREAWLDYLSAFPHQSAYFRAAPEYAHQSSVASGRRVGSDLNLYKLFVERCYRLLREGGHCGLVVPSGVYTDLGAKGIRELLFSRTTIESLFCIENRAPVFEDVHRMFKFVLLQFRRGGETRSFPAAFMRRDVAELDTFPAQSSVAIGVDLVRKLSPDSLSVMEFKSDRDVEIARKLAQFPLLGEEVPGQWRLRLNREFDMTNDSRLFQTSPAAGRLPLFEGKMIWQFDASFAEARYWVEESGAREALANAGDHSSAVLAYQRPRLAIRAVASNVNARTLIAAIVPAGHFCGNSLLVDSGGLNQRESLYLLGVLNSFTLDWLVRQKVTTNLNMFQLYQLPVPRLAVGAPEFEEIADCVEELTGEHAQAVSSLRAEIDIAVAKLYGLTQGDFAHVLESFPLIDRATRDRTLASWK